jgi:hypothetical protein
VKAKKCADSVAGKLFVIDHDFALAYEDKAQDATSWRRSPVMTKILREGDSRDFDEKVYGVYSRPSSRGAPRIPGATSASASRRRRPSTARTSVSPGTRCSRRAASSSATA